LEGNIKAGLFAKLKDHGRLEKY